jgi:hypothetical protein
LQLVQERAWNALEAIDIGKDFFSRTPAAQQLRERMDKWDYMKLKSFCTTKEMVSKLKGPPTEWEKIFASYTSDKGLITRIYRIYKKLNFPKIDEPIKKNFFKERSPNGQKTQEKMLIIPGHKRNANQNHTKTPPHFCENSYH